MLNNRDDVAAEHTEIEPTKTSLLDLPPDVIQNLIPAAANANQDVASIEASRVIAQLVSTNSSLHKLFKPELDKRGAKQLLTYVLQPNKQNTAEVVDIAKANPRLFFIKATAIDYAMDLEGNRREIANWSPYQALFGTSNKALLLLVKPYLDAYLETIPEGYELAVKQEQEKFPHGLDFPPCSEEFNQLINELEAAITNDLQLKTNMGIANFATLALLAKFRNYYKPGSVQTGHHFNMNEMIKIQDISFKNYGLWSLHQMQFFSQKIYGFQQRLLTAPYLDMACTGFVHYMNGLPLQGDFRVEAHNLMSLRMLFTPVPKLMIVPLTLSNDGRVFCLGMNFAINDAGFGQRQVVSDQKWMAKLCQANTLELSTLMHTHTLKHQVPRCVII